MIKHRSNPPPTHHHEAFSVDEGYQNNLSSLLGPAKPSTKRAQPYKRFLQADPNNDNDRGKLKKQMFTSFDAQEGQPDAREEEEEQYFNV